MVNLENMPVKAEDIGRLDANTESLGIPAQLLMECAGLQATNNIDSHFKLASRESPARITVFCGRGNNGGDGFVVARHLATRGHRISVALLGSPSGIGTDIASLNWTILQKLKLNIFPKVLKDSSQVKAFCSSQEVKKSNLLVDALLGTGIKGKIREPVASAIDGINDLRTKDIPVVSLDVASGMDPNTGEVPDKAVECDFRVTFHREKKGIVNKPASNSVIIAPIGTPMEAHIFVGLGDLKRALRKRDRFTHKGQYGKVAIIGGSSTYSGAPSLAAMACQAFGVDLVRLFVPEDIVGVVRGYSPNFIVESGRHHDLCGKDVPFAEKICEWADAVLIGPGMGRSSESFLFFSKIVTSLKRMEKPFVVDADGIFHLSKAFEERKMTQIPNNCLITPHKGELSRLIDVSEMPKNDDFESSGAFLSNKLKFRGGTYLVKGVYDYIVGDQIAPLGYRINSTGCPEMSVGGTGDVLAGLCAAFLSLHNETKVAACAAAHLNGLLGEYSIKKKGPRIQATDLIENCADYLRKIGL